MALTIKSGIKQTDFRQTPVFLKHIFYIINYDILFSGFGPFLDQKTNTQNNECTASQRFGFFLKEVQLRPFMYKNLTPPTGRPFRKLYVQNIMQIGRHIHFVPVPENMN